MQGGKGQGTPTSIHVNPGAVLVGHLPKPLHVVEAIGGKPTRVDLAGADGNDAGHAVALQLPLDGVQIQTPRLVGAVRQLADGGTAQTHDSCGLGERAVAGAGQDADVADAGLQTGTEHAELADAGTLVRRRQAGGDDGLAPAGKTQDVARGGARRQGPARPLAGGAKTEQVHKHTQGGILDLGSDGLARQVHLHVLVVGANDVVGSLGDGEGSARYESPVPARAVLAAEGRRNVRQDVVQGPVEAPRLQITGGVVGLWERRPGSGEFSRSWKSGRDGDGGGIAVAAATVGYGRARAGVLQHPGSAIS